MSVQNFAKVIYALHRGEAHTLSLAALKSAAADVVEGSEALDEGTECALFSAVSAAENAAEKAGNPYCPSCGEWEIPAVSRGPHYDNGVPAGVTYCPHCGYFYPNNNE